jgi:chromosome partitioning protein
LLNQHVDRARKQNQMSKIIALFNQSGGVSKTSLTMNLGYHLAKRQQKVLLVDMDPQASLTAFMGLEPAASSFLLFQVINLS